MIKWIETLNFKNLSIELVIVFIGVYLAQTLSIYQNNIQLKNNRNHFYETFSSELISLDTICHSSVRKINLAQTRFNANKSFENLLSSRVLSFNNTSFIIKSAFNDLNFSALDKEFLTSIELGANLIELIDERIANYNKDYNSIVLNSKINSIDVNYFYTELEYIKELLLNLIIAIEKGALPATQRLLVQNS
jgi:hypothetical protein